MASNEVHKGRLPRLPLTIFKLVQESQATRVWPAGTLSTAILSTDHQQRTYIIVREHHALTVARENSHDSARSDALCPVPKAAVGGWAWVYNTAATTLQGAKPGMDAKVLKAKLSLNWTGPYKVLAVSPCSSVDTPDGSPLGAKLLYLILLSDIPGADAHRRVSVQRCKPCANPNDRGDIPKYSPAGLTKYVLYNLFKKSPPYYVTQDDVSTPIQRLEVETTTGQQWVRGRGVVIAVMYETH